MGIKVKKRTKIIIVYYCDCHIKENNAIKSLKTKTLLSLMPGTDTSFTYNNHQVEG